LEICLEPNQRGEGLEEILRESLSLMVQSRKRKQYTKFLNKEREA
jgi:hypothetical protein